MTNKKPVQFLYLAMACLSLLLTSCDGGLFGTGDGHNNAGVMIDGDVNGGTTGAMENTGTTTDTTTGTTTGGQSTSDNMSTPESQTTAFDNMQPGGQSAAPQLRVLNFTQTNVQVSVNNTALINDLAPEQDSGHILLPPDANRLLFTDVTAIGETNQATLHTVEPFNAAEFSITTVVLRSNANTTFGVITLTTQAEPTDPTTALVRLVQNTSLGDVSRSSTITLVATEPNNSGSDVEFVGLSYNTQATAYADVLTGNYTLSDADDRFASESITIEAGHVYTIVINSIAAPVFRVIDDSL